MRDNGSISSSSNSNSPLYNSNRAITGTKLSTSSSRLKLYYFISLKVNWRLKSPRIRWNFIPILPPVLPTVPTVLSRWKVTLRVIYWWQFSNCKVYKSFVFIFAGPVSSANDSIRRSMPNLNNPSRLRLPQPSSNLNRQHGSESGLRPPTAASGSMIRPPIGSTVNGSLFRPQFKFPTPATETNLKPPNPVIIWDGFCSFFGGLKINFVCCFYFNPSAAGSVFDGTTS